MGRTNSIFPITLAVIVFLSVDGRSRRQCRDSDMNCAVWVATNFSQCDDTALVKEHCLRSCQTCGNVIEPKFGGKAFFPTIPKFTYGEQLDFSIVDDGIGRTALNYSAFAWDINMPEGDPIEIHSENGYLAVEKMMLKDERTDEHEADGIVLTTAMSNGFMTVEEGEIGQNQLKFRLHRIGRISFSHDSAVRLMFREWTMLDEDHLEARLLMTTTITRRLMEHTSIIYEKIYP